MSNGRELLRVGEDSPDRLARGHNRTGEGRITILQQTDNLHQQQLVLLPQLTERAARVALVKSLELREQVVYLILQGKLGEYPYRARVPQPLLEPVQVER